MKKLFATVSLAALLSACGDGADAPTEAAPVEAPEETEETESADATEETETEAEAKPEAESETETAEKAPDQAKANPKAIPARFHGKWDVEDSDCVNESDGLTVISASEVAYYEGGIEVTSVTSQGDAVTVKGDYSEGGMDGTKEASVTLSLVSTASGPKLKNSDREGFPPLKKCG
ncbi:MAG: hypothetical protein AAF687_00480 [Pseudomonadota bacterium]